MRLATAVLLAVAALAACSSSPGSDAAISTAHTTLVDPGTGPANTQPLLPLRAGLRSGPAADPDMTLGPYALHGHDAVWVRSFADGDAQWLEQRDDGVYLLGTRHLGWLVRPILWVPATVRVGMIWQSTADDGTERTFTVVSQTPVATILGTQPAWTIAESRPEGGTFLPRQYVEGFGNPTLSGALVLPEHNPPSPPASPAATALTPLNGGAPVVTSFYAQRVTAAHDPTAPGGLGVVLRLGGSLSYFLNDGSNAAFVETPGVACVHTDGTTFAPALVQSSHTDGIQINPGFWDASTCQDAGGLAYDATGTPQVITLGALGEGIRQKTVGGVGGGSSTQTVVPALAMRQGPDGAPQVIGTSLTGGLGVGKLIVSGGVDNWTGNVVPPSLRPALDVGVDQVLAANVHAGEDAGALLVRHGAHLADAWARPAETFAVHELGWWRTQPATTATDKNTRTHLLVEPEGGIWRVVFDPAGTRFARLGTADLPPDHVLSGAVELTSGQLLVLTTGGYHGITPNSNVAPPPYGVYAWTMPVPATATPERLPLVHTLGMQPSGQDALVCADTTTWSLDGWTLNDQPAQAIHAGDRCVLVLRQPLRPDGATVADQPGQFTVRGSVAGVGPVLFAWQGKTGDALQATVADPDVLGALTGGGATSHTMRYARGLVPQDAQPQYAVDVQPMVGELVIPDAGGHGVWALPMPGSDPAAWTVDTCGTATSCLRLYLFGHDFRAFHLNLGVPVGSPVLVAPVQGGGVLVRTDNAGWDAPGPFHVVHPDGQLTHLTLPTLEPGRHAWIAGVLADGTYCGALERNHPGQLLLHSFCVDPAGTLHEGANVYAAGNAVASALWPTEDGQFIGLANSYQTGTQFLELLDPTTLTVKPLGLAGQSLWLNHDADGHLWGRLLDTGALTSHVGRLAGGKFTPTVDLPTFVPVGNQATTLLVDVDVVLAALGTTAARLVK